MDVTLFSYSDFGSYHNPQSGVESSRCAAIEELCNTVTPMPNMPEHLGEWEDPREDPNVPKHQTPNVQSLVQPQDLDRSTSEQFLDEVLLEMGGFPAAKTNRSLSCSSDLLNISFGSFGSTDLPSFEDISTYFFKDDPPKPEDFEHIKIDDISAKPPSEVASLVNSPPAYVFKDDPPQVEDAVQIHIEEISAKPPSEVASLVNSPPAYVFKYDPPQVEDAVQIHIEEISAKPPSEVPSVVNPPPALPVVPIRKPRRTGGKRIDVQAQRYIIDDNPPEDEGEVDIETVSAEPSPVIEAGCAQDLLAQFEATAECVKFDNPPKVETKTETVIEKKPVIARSLKHNSRGQKRKAEEAKPLKQQPKVQKKKLEKARGNNNKRGSALLLENKNAKFIKQESAEKKRELEQTSNNIAKPLKQEPKTQKRKLEEACNIDAKRNKKVEEKLPIHDCKSVTEKNSIPQAARVLPKPSKEKQKVNILSQELIDRIKKQSSEKRKTVTVIEAIPNIKKKKSKVEVTTVNANPASSRNTVNLDHNYCVNNKPSVNTKCKNSVTKPKLPKKKDVGFVSPKADDKTLISLQPAEKIADGINKTSVNTMYENGVTKPQFPMMKDVGSVSPKVDDKTVISLLPTVKNEDGKPSVNTMCENGVIKPQLPMKKDTGFVPANEDDKTVISLQPTVKNADGTLMVSLLKTNTIHKVESVENKRKKLNLSEYKKRLGKTDTVKPKTEPQECSANASTGSSPANEEGKDERALRHYAKLQKMADELLKTTPKSEQKRPEMELKLPSFAKEFAKAPLPPTKPQPPQRTINMMRKIVVDFGTTTDFQLEVGQQNLLAPVEKLQEMRPLIDHVVKNNENSLIASVMATIPKLIEQYERPNKVTTQKLPGEKHGENKRKVYIKNNQPRKPTREIAIQTDMSLMFCSVGTRQSKTENIRQESNERYRNNSTSKVNSRSPYDSHRSKQSSCSYRPTDYPPRSHSSSTSSRKSSSISPPYTSLSSNSNSEEEYSKAVDERRIIYVGKISRKTTKEELYRKFWRFGPINRVTLHFRDTGYTHMENYGFVTFKYMEHAHDAFEHGNDDPAFPRYKISFGGRRGFCRTPYADLDNVEDKEYTMYQKADDSYDRLLKETMGKMQRKA